MQQVRTPQEESCELLRRNHANSSGGIMSSANSSGGIMPKCELLRRNHVQCPLRLRDARISSNWPSAKSCVSVWGDSNWPSAKKSCNRAYKTTLLFSLNPAMRIIRPSCARTQKLRSTRTPCVRESSSTSASCPPLVTWECVDCAGAVPGTSPVRTRRYRLDERVFPGPGGQRPPEDATHDQAHGPANGNGAGQAKQWPGWS